MSNEISLEYGDVLKAYQAKCNDLLTQLTTAEARLIASANYINKLNVKIEELEVEIKKVQKTSSKTNKKNVSESSDEVMDYN